MSLESVSDVPIGIARDFSQRWSPGARFCVESQNHHSNRNELYFCKSRWHNCHSWSVTLVQVYWVSQKMAQPCSCPFSIASAAELW